MDDTRLYPSTQYKYFSCTQDEYDCYLYAIMMVKLKHWLFPQTFFVIS